MRSGFSGLLVVALVGLLLCLGSCSRVATEPVERKILLLGIDGIEWDILGPMLEEGRLPNFARIMQEGTWGELQSLQFLESPMIWTSIATGKVSEKHGITGFTTKPGSAREGAILTSNFRNVRTVWDIVGETGRDVGVVLWLVTWPPEPVNGYLVSDYLGYNWNRPGRTTEDMTYPASLADELEEFLVRAGDVPDARAAEFLRGGVPPDEDLAAKLWSLKTCIAVDEIARSVGLYLAEEKPVDFYAVYFRGLDAVCHHFWVDMFPESGPPVSEREAEVFGEVITRYYEEMDRLLGEFIDLVDENTTLIVTSDHGHSGPKPRGDSYAWGIAMHDPTGVLILWGKDVVSDGRLSLASVLDITPTILALYGLPVAEDMDGRVLVEAIDQVFLKGHPPRGIATYESEAAREDDAEKEPIESSVDDEIRERLRSLGYIE